MFQFRSFNNFNEISVFQASGSALFLLKVVRINSAGVYHTEILEEERKKVSANWCHLPLHHYISPARVELRLLILYRSKSTLENFLSWGTLEKLGIVTDSHLAFFLSLSLSKKKLGLLFLSWIMRLLCNPDPFTFCCGRGWPESSSIKTYFFGPSFDRYACLLSRVSHF